ncbi:phosphoglycerate mutase-like protein [Vararia minispora EC-137]|uniref:Phosphoglycerate mutase-like protein n=1 Tax=Vararia minispora EC-137 TaxID=1314806 RepID=A0ACB8QH33_9AGAM|nr:phosphoglycerate mutase-like protein [Vararia minispora EC-137]
MLATVGGLLVVPLAALAANVPRELASSFAGAPTSFQFPPADVTPVTFPDPNFPDAAQVGFPGPTPTGDEAFALATAPAVAQTECFDPIVRPDTSDRRGSTFNVVRNWGNLSPWFSLPAGTFGLPKASPLVPNGCDLTQVHILHRHGARYPTSGSAPAAFAAKIQSLANSTGFDATGPLEFLATWEYKLGAEILTPLGRQQLYDLGVNARVRYGVLLKGFTDIPVWRTTSEGVLQFAAGFFGVQQFTTSYHQLIEIESPGFNTTLAPYEICKNNNVPTIGGLGNTKAAEWAAVYTVPTIKRLSKHITNVNLTSTDIVAMQMLCAYESVALGYSAFCDLFTESEWESFEYFIDLGFWYSNGPGGSTVAAQGVGYVQELISRLTQTRITDFNTAVNSTIVSSNVTFPLVQPIFVDASHDTVISSIAVALNLTSLAKGGPLPTDRIAKDRQWVVSHVAPFGTNLVAQVLSCPAKSAGVANLTTGSTSGTPTHVRWILNDAVVPLTGVQGCTEDQDGLCNIDTYIAGTQARIDEIDFQFDCLGNYTIPEPDDITDGRAPR